MKSGPITIFMVLLIFACIVLGILLYVPDYYLRESFRDIFATFEATIKIALVIICFGIGLAVIITAFS